MFKIGDTNLLVSLIFLLGLAEMGFALPKYERTSLPLPRYINIQDQAAALEVLRLEVYQDSEDPNQYYYVPPFHVRQYTRGAASMMLHSHNVKQFSTAIKSLQERDDFGQEKLSEIRREIRDAEAKKSDTELMLFEAISQNNERLVSLLEKRIAQQQKTIDELKHERKMLAESLLKKSDQLTSFHLAQAGFNVDVSKIEDSTERLELLKNASTHAASSYGGYLSINAYGGFTRSQLDALSVFKARYLPNVRVSLLPIDDLTFFPLTEAQGGTGDGEFSKIFRQINGSGDYLGAAIVMDTSIAGSLGLAEHLAPFILPVGIKAVLKQQLKPAEAILTCDFSNGFSVKGRADVRDGLIIYDNDITNTIKAEDNNLGACNLEHIKGDVSSAEYAALKEMEAVYENMRLTRSQLSQKEKEAYFRGVQNDIQNNRRTDEKGDPHYTKILTKFTSFGWQELAIEGLAKAADFYWHTNEQDVSNISKVKFTKKLSIQGHKTIDKPLPTNLCLVYNSQLNAYDRCTETEESQASTMRQSMTEAAQSPICQNAEDPFDCGRRRDTLRDSEYRPQPHPSDGPRDTMLADRIG
ncbi:MAG TPA: hypothetical protein VEL47_05885 [Myxococcota bacterium]|nr:hypothetical protein [Myxococcota bacterium]